MIVIHESESQRQPLETDTRRRRNIPESSSAFVVINSNSVGQTQNDVVATIVIVIANSAPSALSGGVQAGLSRHIRKTAARVAEKPARPAGQQQVGAAIGVEVNETCTRTGKLCETVRRAGGGSRRVTFYRQCSGSKADSKIL